MNKTIIISLIAILLSACSDEDSVESTSTASSSDHEKEGIACIKTSGTIEVKTYIGLVNIDDVVYTGIRTDRSVKFGDDTQDMGSSLVLDDGSTTETYAISEAGVMKKDYPESTYNPDDIETAIMMGKTIHGDCDSWDVDSSMFQRPTKSQ